MGRGTILYLDSGVGGLPYLGKLRTALPKATHIYLGDSANFPYGRKSPSQICDAVVSAVEKASSRFSIDTLLVACNTATVVALHTLRNSFSFPVVGVVPAIKPAGTLSKKRRIAILATERTVKDQYTAQLKEVFASDCDIIPYGLPKLVSYIEERYITASSEENRREAESIIRQVRESHADTIVLACTHFLFLKEYFVELAEGEIEIIDSLDGVVRQTQKVFKESNRRATNETSGFYVTGEANSDRYRRFSTLMNLPFKGAL